MVIAGTLGANDDGRIRLRKLNMPAAAGVNRRGVMRDLHRRRMPMFTGMITANGGRFFRLARFMFAMVTARGTEIQGHRTIATQAQIQRRAAPANELREC